ncbi:hypothetical protein [Actinacidiphila glaucinigra]|uniref:hypothetical protein n=1 Tax=Actinacidiphila glaucinigra TaxID=235986 RepID=UPI00366C941E
MTRDQLAALLAANGSVWAREARWVLLGGVGFSCRSDSTSPADDIWDNLSTRLEIEQKMGHEPFRVR